MTRAKLLTPVSLSARAPDYKTPRVRLEDGMSHSDKVWLGISGGATVVGAVMAFLGMPLGFPCVIIGGMILVTTVTNLSKSE